MNKLTIYLLLLLLSVGACRDMANNAETAGPLLAFEGTYKMEKFQYQYFEYNDAGEVITDTTLSIASHPYITLKKAEGYTDKIEMDSREFIEDLFF